MSAISSAIINSYQKSQKTLTTTGTGQYGIYSGLYPPTTIPPGAGVKLDTSGFGAKWNVWNPLEKLDYIISFDFTGKDFTKDLLIDNLKSIKGKKMFFNCDMKNNRIQPYELLMKLIERKEKFSVKIKISDVLTINYVNFRFTEICNNLNFSETDKCDFSVLSVRFKYDNILHENHKLSTKQLRTDKMKKIIQVNESDNC